MESLDARLDIETWRSHGRDIKMVEVAISNGKALSFTSTNSPDHFRMRSSTIAIALTAATLASAQLTYNITQALKPGNFAKYRCL